MTKAELIDEIRGAKGIDLTKKQTEQVVGAVFDAIREAIKRDQRFHTRALGRSPFAPVRHAKVVIQRTGKRLRSLLPTRSALSQPPS